MDVFRLRLGFAAEPDLGAACLKRLAVGARRDLAIGVLARKPDFNVIGLGCAEPDVAGRQHDGAVCQSQRFKYGFRDARQAVQLFVRLRGSSKLDQLSLVEWMLADQSLCVLAVAARL